MIKQLHEEKGETIVVSNRVVRTCFMSLAAVSLLSVGRSSPAQQPPDLIHQPYLLNTGLTSRSISFENPTGAPGEGGKAADKARGVGRKGHPAEWNIPAGKAVQLCDIAGPGTIRHIWVTTEWKPEVLRTLVIRATWDDQQHPSIECPLGDFFGFAHGKVTAYQSAVHSVGPLAGMNIWLPMPFAKRAKITITNEGDKPARVIFYQLTYTLGDKHPDDVGRLHVLFRRENPTTEKKDFELLPLRKNKGRYIGAVIGVRNLHPGDWWGEGEFKVYMDGDTQFPTICGTGSEDYVGLAWGVQSVQYLYHGCNLTDREYKGADLQEEVMLGTFVSMYRWHLPDPIAWQKEARITIQQIRGSSTLHRVVETTDDWSCATFWYEPLPSAPLSTMPDVKARTADLWTEASAKE
jgi:hypothetical protein